MTREERLNLLKQIEKDIYVCSLESTFLDDAKSCAIHSAIEELEQEPKTKIGRWIETECDEELYGTCYECSSCGEYVLEAKNYCPYCGAKMDKK